jgi:hypothetical protein
MNIATTMMGFTGLVKGITATAAGITGLVMGAATTMMGITSLVMPITTTVIDRLCGQRRGHPLSVSVSSRITGGPASGISTSAPIAGA